jgi:hypothetical protein
MAKVGEIAVAIALREAQMGAYERANDNRGERVDEYVVASGGQLGQAWCAMFVYWCFNQAARQLGVNNPMPAIFGAAQLQLWAKNANKLVATPALGDILIKESRHAGLVTGSALGNGTFPSVEGNTWANTDLAHRREGVYVLKNERVAKCRFIRVA